MLHVCLIDVLFPVSVVTVLYSLNCSFREFGQFFPNLEDTGIMCRRVGVYGCNVCELNGTE